MATVGNTHDRRARSVPTVDDGTNSGRIDFRLVSQNQDRRFRFRANSLKAVSNGSAATFAEVGCFHKPGSHQRNAPSHLLGLMANDESTSSKDELSTRRTTHSRRVVPRH